MANTVGGGLASPQTATLEPHLSEYGSRGNGGMRYPNPFFDLAQQYSPRTVKELFRWCTYFYYTDPLVASTITKISRYPITKLIVEDPNEKTKDKWEEVFNDHLKIRDRLMETNLDLNVYGNAFVSMHLPFTRFLVCQSCKTRSNIEHLSWKWQNYGFGFTCPKCKTAQTADVSNKDHIKDVPYRVLDDVRMVRWNPENMAIRYNEATGETHYFYNVSRTLRYQIQVGERDILEKLPLLFIEAVRKSRLIKLSSKNLFHLKRHTLAEKDMGWGKPLIQSVLKDLYYMATLRKAQEAIANEHIVPFDFLFPQPNAQMDPFVHTDLGNWRIQVEDIVKKHRRDPNYKAILPVPIGFGRLGGDGKALMLTPELNYLNQKIVGGMGIPQEFLFGGLNWTGSSITLRSLQNDFQHNQTQLLELTKWIKNKIRIFLRLPDVKRLRFMDFKMADDIQRVQQLISLNAQRKVSDETLLTELGLDYEKEVKKIISELNIQNEMQDIMAKAQAKTSGETQITAWNYQQAAKDQANQGGGEFVPGDPNAQGPYANEQSALAGGQGQVAPPAQGAEAAQGQSEYQDQTGMPVQGAQPTTDSGGNPQYMDVEKMADRYAGQLAQMQPGERTRMLTQMRQQMPEFATMVEKKMNELLAQGAGMQGGGGNPTPGAGASGQSPSQSGGTDMSAMPEKGAPRRGGSF
jgi:hypothetical protein